MNSFSVSETAMGVDIGTQANSDFEYPAAISRLEQCRMLCYFYMLYSLRMFCFYSLIPTKFIFHFVSKICKCNVQTSPKSNLNTLAII